MGLQRLSAVLVASLVVAVAPIAASAGGERSGGGKIDDARDGLDGDDDDDDDSSTRDHRDDGDDSGSDDTDYYYSNDDDDDGDSNGLGTVIFWYSITSPWWGPAVAGGDMPWPRPFGFQSYPFEDGAPGPHAFLEPGVAPPTKLVAMRVMASYEDQLDGTVGQRLAVQTRSNIRLNLDGEITRYDEELAGGGEDHLWHSKLTATYSHSVSPRAHFTTGVGFRHLRFAGGDNSYGWAIRYAAEFFPTRSLHLWTMGELGANSNKFTAEWEVALGFLVNRVELFGGYRLFRVVGVNFDGPEAGMAVWF